MIIYTRLFLWLVYICECNFVIHLMIILASLIRLGIYWFNTPWFKTWECKQDLVPCAWAMESRQQIELEYAICNFQNLVTWYMQLWKSCDMWHVASIFSKQCANFKLGATSKKKFLGRCNKKFLEAVKRT